MPVIKNDEISELIEKELSKPNYIIKKFDGKMPYTVIYFSSNGQFGLNDVNLFKHEIIEKNKFEFFKTRIEKESKHICIRDIKRRWYLDGINNELDSFGKLLEFLKEETKGTKVITVGSSAGGFASILYGIFLNAEYIFSFSAQFSLEHHCKYDKSLQRFKDDKYFNILELVKNSGIPIFYALSSGCKQDINQLNLVKDFKNVHSLVIKSRIHGISFKKYALKKVINCELSKLYKMYNSRPNEIKESFFMLKHFGVFSALSCIYKKNLECFNRKYFKA